MVSMTFSARNRPLSWSLSKIDKDKGSVDKMLGSGQYTDSFFDPINSVSLSTL